jgi:hypothetical protein
MRSNQEPEEEELPRQNQEPEEEELGQHQVLQVMRMLQATTKNPTTLVLLKAQAQTLKDLQVHRIRKVPQPKTNSRPALDGLMMTISFPISKKK